jgi:hypothetical protein
VEEDRELDGKHCEFIETESFELINLFFDSLFDARIIR